MHVLISAGPTREKIDPVRFISNRSSGKMGYAIAEAAQQSGAEVLLVSGPVALPCPAGVLRIDVESAAEMADAVKKNAPQCDLIIMAAAVADYRPITVAEHKIKKKSGNLFLELERTEDILASLGQTKRPGQILVGFAAETDDLELNALDKLRRKNLDWIAANQVSDGFGTDTNRIRLFNGAGEKFDLPLADKKSIAAKLYEIVSEPLNKF